jgi:hypothetical protein
MRCPHCHKHIKYPTQRQLLAWFYRYVYEHSEPEVAKIMGINQRSVRELMQRMKKVWPNVFVKPRRRRITRVHFNENIHSSRIRAHL